MAEPEFEWNQTELLLTRSAAQIVDMSLPGELHEGLQQQRQQQSAAVMAEPESEWNQTELLLTRSQAQIVDMSLPGRKIYTECPRIEYSRQASDLAALISSKLAPLQVQASAGLRQRQGRRAPVLLLANSSFPMGASLRTPLARPDLVSLGLYHGLLYRLKVIVSVRNISDVMASAIRAHYDKDDTGLQVRLVEDSLVYLDASLRQLPCGTYAIVNLDHLMSSPSVSPFFLLLLPSRMVRCIDHQHNILS
ncbi:unnamed protein product [Closterium sp. NIES-64]|nr:unnamed protein product [Closterium sp. NIES-64]CAI5992257.1 unnamed protein product [Closterium sp. NIES-65]